MKIHCICNITDFSPGVATVWTPGPRRSDAGKHRFESG